MFKYSKNEAILTAILALIIVFLLFRFSFRMIGDEVDERTFTTPERIWLEFVVAMENNDLEFLIEHSRDSVTCVDCIKGDLKWEEEKYPARFLFENYLTELMHFEKLSQREFSSYQDSTMIRIGYGIESPKAEEGGYTLVFTLEREGNEYLLADRFFVP